MVDETDGNTRRRADAAHGHSIMTILLEATKGRLDEGLAAHRRGLAMKFGTQPLRRHAIAFSNSFRHISIAGRALLYVRTDPVCDVPPGVEIPILHGCKVPVFVYARGCPPARPRIPSNPAGSPDPTNALHPRGRS